MNSSKYISNATGTVYVEFIIVIIPLIILIFGLIQLGLVYAANLMVNHAAARSARAAIVIFPEENEDEYEGVPINQVGSGEEGLETYEAATKNGRLDQIRNAARFTLAPISPAIESYTSSSISSAIGDHSISSALLGLLGWTKFGVAVTFPNGNGSYLSTFSARGPITTRVTYLYKCSIPIVNSIMCDTFHQIDKTAKEELSTVDAENLLTSLGENFLGWRFLAITAERTLPNQGL